MKKKLVVVLTILMLVLLFSSVLAVSAQPKESTQIECVIDIHTAEEGVPQEDDWYGDVRDCSLEGLNGHISFNEQVYVDPVGKTIHFIEDFKIMPYDGSEIIGYNLGVWTLSTGKFRANGYVTEASDEWAYLVGYKYHEMGVTDSTDLSDPTITFHAPGTVMTLHAP